jgi:PAS domain S-box-containing protein
MALEDIVIGGRQASISPMLVKQLFETSLDLILVTDRRGQFIEISPSSMAILGYRPDEMVGQTGTRFIYPDDLDRTRNEMRRASHGGSQTQNFESRYVHKNGSIVTLDWNGAWSECEQLHFFVGRDASPAKLIEHLKDEFVATVSHELRTPLTSIAGALSLLINDAGGTLPVPAKRLLTIAHANSQRLVRLVNNILDMERIESGKVVFVQKQVEVRSLVEEAIEANRGFADGFGVRIKLNVAAAAGDIRGDPDWLLQVVTNLLSNAVKFSPPGEEVEVAIENLSGAIRISVRDHGHGVPDDFKQRIFEKFAQADASDARQLGGTGLGLSIVKQIVTRLGGEVSFGDAPGGGAIFHVVFPGWEQAIATIPEFNSGPNGPVPRENELGVVP